MRRNWFVAAVAVGIVAIVVAAIAMRLTEDDPETTAAWADSVCTSLSDWRSSIAVLADPGDEALTAETLGDRLDQADDATSDLVDELRDLGPPDLDAGDDVQQALDSAAAGLAASYADVQSAAEDAADADDTTELLEALADLADDFAALADQAGDIVATLQSASLFGDASAELEQAFAASDSCQALQADS
ncbi:MAG TPA: hypothetical protein VJ807_08355 [Gaiellaceae bacterium]|nr:hypothetical protein [Gaiellaceae bacterium]